MVSMGTEPAKKDMNIIQKAVASSLVVMKVPLVQKACGASSKYCSLESLCVVLDPCMLFNSALILLHIISQCLRDLVSL